MRGHLYSKYLIHEVICPACEQDHPSRFGKLCPCQKGCSRRPCVRPLVYMRWYFACIIDPFQPNLHDRVVDHRVVGNADVGIVTQRRRLPRCVAKWLCYIGSIDVHIAGGGTVDAFVGFCCHAVLVSVLRPSPITFPEAGLLMSFRELLPANASVG